jgi:hypothetical protein
VPIFEVCGNDYDKAFEVVREGETHVFDSFGCAIHSLAPTCEHCGCHVIGHGVEAGDSIFCCAHCATVSGADGVADRGRAGFVTGLRRVIAIGAPPWPETCDVLLR